MELEELYRLMTEFRKSGLGKLEYKTDGFSVKMEMPQPAPVYASVTAPRAPESPAAAAAGPGTAGTLPAQSLPAVPAEGEFIKSPLVGTFYAAPGEGSEPYVKEGSRVGGGDTVCIVEAMKMMNEVTAPYDCIIEEILKNNAEAAGFDEPLFRIRKI